MRRSWLTHFLGCLLLLISAACLANNAHRQTAEIKELLQTPISITVNELLLVDLLHILARLGNTHFVLSPSIQGNISLQLEAVPWQTALSTVLASRGLRFVRNDGLYWIGSHSEISSFQKQRRDESAYRLGENITARRAKF